MTRIRTAIRRLLCPHRVRLDDIRRRDAELVVAPCRDCGKVLVARYGAALPARLEQR